jgi:drug/metabolite transporter (DMT)-like permease
MALVTALERDGIAAAVAAGCLYSLSVVLQKSQAEAVAETGVAILRPLMTRPLWLLGVALQVLGLAFHGFALTAAPVTIVQPIIASGIAFLVLFAALILGERPSAREILGMALSVSGVGLLASQIHGPVALAPLDTKDFAFAIAAAAALAALLWCLGRWGRMPSTGLRAALIGGAAGVGQGMSDAMNRLAGAWFAPHGWIPPTGVLCAALVFLLLFGFQGFVVAQNAFQRYRANTVVPCLITAQLFVPVAMAIVLFGQPGPRDGEDASLWMLALMLTFTGIVWLARAPGVERALAGGVQPRGARARLRGPDRRMPDPPAGGGAGVAIGEGRACALRDHAEVRPVPEELVPGLAAAIDGKDELVYQKRRRRRRWRRAGRLRV